MVRWLIIVSGCLSSVSLGLALLAIYDFYYRPELPFREEDLQRLLRGNLTKAVVFGLIALVGAAIGARR